VGTVVLELIQGQDQLRVWSSRDKGKENVLIDAGGANGATARKVWVLNGTDILAKLPQTLYLEGVKAANSASDTAILVTKYISPEGVETEADRLLITVYRGGLVPDYDRNGIIDEQDRAKVNGDKPWRFWVNDDNDGAADGSGIGSSDNDLPGLNKDNGDGVVNGIRDLVDFFPLQLDLGQLITLLPPDQGYSYWLRQAIGAVAVVEGIQVDPALLASNSGSYLTEIDIANKFAKAATTVVTAAGVKLSDAFIQAIKDNNQAGVVLLEGRKETTLPLVVEVRDDGDQPVASVFLPLEIVGVEQMFGHRNLRPEAGGPGGDGDRYTDLDTGTPPKIKIGNNMEIGKQPFCMQGVDKTLIWMHGYNVSPQEVRGTYAEVFKRFFHAGLNGRFFGVSWFGNPPAIGSPHYHQAVVNAFATAGEFTRFVESLPGSTAIAAHSLGNLVVGAAIQDKGLANFSKYFAFDAAVPLEAYGQVSDVSTLVKPDGTINETIPEAGMVNVGDWPKYIAAGQSRLLASEWYQRFPDSDNRSKLTWRKRLLQVPSGKVYNFYSSTEDVLRAYLDDGLATLWGLLTNLKSAKEYLATSAFVKEEKFKGRPLPPGFNFCGVSSRFAGWSYNPDWDVENVHLTPAQAASIDKDELKTKPFFDPPKSNPIRIGLDELLSDYGSDFVEVEVKYTGLDSYYTDNNAAHDKVKVKDWLLAEAFPATTLPMGANRYSKLESNNIDMSGEKNDNGGCCKTSEGAWPRNQKLFNQKEWRHSDYKDVAYQHVYGFYNRIQKLSK